MLRQLEDGDGMVLRNRRELIEEMVKRVARFQIVDQRLYGNACAGKNRRSPEPIG